MAEIRELIKEEFRTMQLLQLDMIKELDRVYRENDINYVIIAGTLLDYMIPPPEGQRELYAPVSSFNFDVSKQARA